RDHANASRLLKQYLVVAPGDHEARIWRGHCLGHLRQEEEGEAELTEAIRLCQIDHNAWSHRAMIRMNRENYEGVIEDLTRSLAIDPTLAPDYRLRGEARINRREYTDALPDLDRAIELAPRNARGYDLRGIAMYKLGKVEAALVDFEKARAITTNPSSHEEKALEYYDRIRDQKLAGKRPVAPPATVAGGRLAMPEPAALKEAESTVRKLFRAEYSRLSPPSLRTLGRKLLITATEGGHDDAVTYVLLREAK